MFMSLNLNTKSNPIIIPFIHKNSVKFIIEYSYKPIIIIITEMPLPEPLLTSLQRYKKESQPQLLSQLLNLNLPQSQQSQFNQQYEQQIKNTFMDLTTSGSIDDLCSFLNVVWKSLQNRIIKKNVLIVVLDSVLECVGIDKLGDVLGIIRERVGEMRDVLTDIAHPLLRIINTLLKRISKTTDFQVRGQLHLTITRIINLCHESGFDYRPGTVHTNNKIQIQEGLLQSFKQSKISIEFYDDFWELQRYFMDISELGKQEGKEDVTPNKQDPKLVSIRLKRIQIILDNVLSYFRINKPIENKDFANFPLKFLKLPNLLELQLQDSYFRLVILVQAIIFCSSLKTFPTKHQMKITDEAKQSILRIEKKITEYLQTLLAQRKDAGDLTGMLNSYLKNDLFWISLKDNWRQRKKTFFKNSAVQENATDIKKQPSVSEVAAPEVNPQKKPMSLTELAAKCKKQIEKKMQIRPNFIEAYINYTQVPVLKKQPIAPSFAYYYSQAKQCLQTFDQAEQCQTEFESRAEYNLFEWRAFRSLQRQRIVTTFDNDYKLLDFVKKKSDVFQGGEPRKRVKLTEEDKDE